MSTRIAAPRRLQSGVVLLDAVMAIGLTGLIMLVLVAVMQFSGRSFLCLANYVELDDRNRLAIDQLTRDLRECNRIAQCTTNLLTLESADGLKIYYLHSPEQQTLTRLKTRSLKDSKPQFTANLEEAPMAEGDVAGAPDVLPEQGKESVTPQESTREVLLTGCESLSFRLFKRNTMTNSYEQFPASLPDEAKVVDIAWKCSRSILGIAANTEAVQTAKIVIRKQGS
ncbi:MAG: hypothetical protein RJA22_1021 [Verrucomicrobiota bacterium]